MTVSLGFKPLSTLDELLAAVVVGLTQTQRDAIVGSLVATDPKADVVLIDAAEGTVRSLMRRTPPLVREEGARRFLNKLGLDVARYLYTTGNYER